MLTVAILLKLFIIFKLVKTNNNKIIKNWLKFSWIGELLCLLLDTSESNHNNKIII